MDPLVLLPGVAVAIAFFVLIGFVVWVLRDQPTLTRVIMAITVLVAGLPPILYALFWIFTQQGS